MSDCLNQRIERLLHAYELGMVTDEERQEVESHLLTCENCFKKAQSLELEIELLLRDQEALHLTSKKTDEASAHAIMSRERKKIFRYMLAAVLVIAVSITIYNYLIVRDDSHVVQSLEFNPLRDVNEKVIDTKLPGEIEVRFVVEGAVSGDSYSVGITSIEGVQIITFDSFTDFNAAGQGVLVVPVKLFSPGHYKLGVSTSAGDSTVVEYLFRAK